MSHSTISPDIWTECDANDSPSDVDLGQWLNLDDLPQTEFDPGHINDQPLLESRANDQLSIEEVSTMLSLQTRADIFQLPLMIDGGGSTDSLPVGDSTFDINEWIRYDVSSSLFCSGITTTDG
jgi:hypothetical protein